MGCRGAPGGHTLYFSVCIADTEIRDGCHCTRRTFPLRRLKSEPASSWEGSFALGWRAAFWRPPASPVQKPESLQRSYDRGAVFWRGELWRAASAARQGQNDPLYV
ncbi:hypothetical protein NDU88_004425 [Pleurodeles waltl]|uniref:Uncharacterized protein n=1 Tax=Pleurodeles waltl TaxID=8319 RepID=A0AAV7VH18_PLEWA|nr:hypothetical protein NDU88_004425 [Pleurodeles waltl]